MNKMASAGQSTRPIAIELPIETGPGTPGGDLLRCYWQPVILKSDFPESSPPRALKMLGEDLVLFRTEAGELGLLGLRCAHRCADLSYGRVEGGGIRCIYHGWLYDREGHCKEQPGEPGGGKHRDRIRQSAYPCVERGGAIWAYMGKGSAPLFPEYPALTAPDEYRFTARWKSNCNYLQANEGNIDPVHTSYLHAFTPESSDESGLAKHVTQQIFGVDTAPRISTQDTRWGLRVMAHRVLPDAGKELLRVTNFVMPNACAIGGSETPLGRGGMSMFWHVPIDDTSHWRYEFIFHSKKRLPIEELREAYDREMDATGVPWRNSENRFGQRRDELHRSYIGMGPTFPSHDLFITESQAPILNRTAEHLVSSDVAIVRARRLLSSAMADVALAKDPPGVVREGCQNDFSDILVLTETVTADAPIDSFLKSMKAADIYRLSTEFGDDSVSNAGETN